ncbi:hypothetical protein ACFO25_11795 [Paenactinomyces guangxiensis]|uniref:Uncharacterized protein n=1 Tax=Paenactinomyces guangxiensis TaxID=1490290 RepID=A0A7W1WUA5_9BACL|nr:hypothetical protein [Paenactinomyces guangxiensis]MBA4496179.1 hypothetical protein [Paenactinomyces guangxiensis]MBH8593268.1 hypothetical protein [Paenactinomyces guangxiensis]
MKGVTPLYYYGYRTSYPDYYSYPATITREQKEDYMKQMKEMMEKHMRMTEEIKHMIGKHMRMTEEMKRIGEHMDQRLKRMESARRDPCDP